jgi:hypothetical protein
MPTILDYAESIIRLELQAIRQFEDGSKKGQQAAKTSLRAIILDTEVALKSLNLSDEDRAWFVAKQDRANRQLSKGNMR